MYYNIIIEKEEQQLNDEESMNIEEEKLIKSHPFYQNAEKQILELMKKEKQMLQGSLLQEFKIKMERIEEDCKSKQDRLLNRIIQEMKAENLLDKLKKELTDKKNEN